MAKVEIEDTELEQLQKELNEAKRRLADVTDDWKAASSESKERKLAIRKYEKDLEELKAAFEAAKAKEPEYQELLSYKQKYVETQENERKAAIEKLSGVKQTLSQFKDTDKNFGAAKKLLDVIGNDELDKLQINDIQAKLSIIDIANGVSGILSTNNQQSQTVDAKNQVADDKSKPVTRSGVLYDPFNK